MACVQRLSTSARKSFHTAAPQCASATTRQRVVCASQTLSCSAARLAHCPLLQLLLLTTPPASSAAATTCRSELQGASSSTRSYRPPSNLQEGDRGHRSKAGRVGMRG